MGGSKSGNNKTGGAAVRAAVTQRERGGATEPELSPAALDRWLNEKLRVLYGPVLSEPIPDDLAQLIELHRRDKGDC
jgi:Anti-sigma factor NepR